MDPNFMKWSQLASKFLGKDFFADMMDTMPGNGPKADVYHGKREVVVLLELPGIDDIQQVDVRVDGDTLYVKGFIPSRYTHYEATQSECYTGSFERKIHLGAFVTRSNSSARYRKGVLEIRLPKVSSGSSRSSNIHVRDNG